MFSKFDINYKENLFEELFKSTKFEKLGKGRYGAVLADIHKNVVQGKAKLFLQELLALPKVVLK